MNIQPYFYIIQHITSLKYYAGYKSYGYGSDNLMTPDGYKTSSKEIKRLINRDGLGAFIIRKIKRFKTTEEAYEYEFRFLTKVNAKDNVTFLNLGNSREDPKFSMTEKLKKYLSDINTGKVRSIESKNKQSETLNSLRNIVKIYLKEKKVVQTGRIKLKLLKNFEKHIVRKNY